MSRSNEMELAVTVRNKLMRIADRGSKAMAMLPFPKHRKEAVRQLELMASQLDAVVDMKGPARQKAALLYVPGDSSKTLVTCIIAPDRKRLLKRLANWARFNPEVDILGEKYTDARALDALERTYDLTYLDAYY